ncbi:YARHG domain-containing protein [Clostridium drakei]|uniref:YARHG domain-containing protein n=1 Tax=Clostridium drakei TaxID=332101 RepID=A0A2U8DT83_9CLOT|nr:YARHG domain-containing protein [Clostridium drakei]AWI05302.1 hypothetical protein B9W14_12570 [Clostridium drakei]
MSKCRKCGYELSNKDKFCPSCGTKHKIEEDNINRETEDNIIKDTIRNEDNLDENTIVEKGEYVEFIEHKEKRDYDDNTINIESNTNEFDKVDNKSESRIGNLKSRGIKLKALAAAIVLVFFVGFGITYMHLSKGKNNNSSDSNNQTIYNNEKTSTKQNTEKDSKKQTEEKDENSNEYILPYSNKRPITKNDLKGLSKKQLQLARNEIFARHGYVFGEPFKSYFKSKSWYKEDKSFTGEGKQLSALERHNIKVIIIQEGGKVAPGYDSDYKESDYTN